MVKETLRQQQEEMVHCCLQGREENKETEPPEAAEMQRGHRVWAHTHHSQHLPCCQPCRSSTGARLPPVTPLQRWLWHWTWLSDAAGHGAGCDTGPAEGGGNGALMSSPRHGKAGWGKYHCCQGSSHSTYPLRAAQQGFSFWDENFKQLGNCNCVLCCRFNGICVDKSLGPLQISPKRSGIMSHQRVCYISHKNALSDEDSRSRNHILTPLLIPAIGEI